MPGQIYTPEKTPAHSEPNFICKDVFVHKVVIFCFFNRASDLAFSMSRNYNCSHLSYVKKH